MLRFYIAELLHNYKTSIMSQARQAIQGHQLSDEVDLLMSSDEESVDEHDQLLIKLHENTRKKQSNIESQEVKQVEEQQQVADESVIDLTMLSDNESEDEEERQFLENRAQKKAILDALNETQKNEICLKFFAAYRKYIPVSDTTALYTLLFARISMTQANAIAERNVLQLDYNIIPDGYHEKPASDILAFFSSNNIDFHQYNDTAPGFHKEICEKYGIVSAL